MDRLGEAEKNQNRGPRSDSLSIRAQEIAHALNGARASALLCLPSRKLGASRAPSPFLRICYGLLAADGVVAIGDAPAFKSSRSLTPWRLPRSDIPEPQTLRVARTNQEPTYSRDPIAEDRCVA